HTRSKRDWSSDVCSSDLSLFAHGVSDGEAGLSPAEVEAELSDDGSASGEDGASDGSGASDGDSASDDDGDELAATGTDVTVPAEIGRASCRERGQGSGCA